MAAYDLEEQEQLAAIKAWWEKNSNTLTGLVLALVVLVAGIQGWRWYENKQTSELGALYSALAQAATEKDASRVGVLADELLSKHGATVSAGLAALQAAQVAVDAGDLKLARSRLEAAAANKADPLLQDVARLRLASMQFDSKEFEPALATLANVPSEPFMARFEDLRGDILFAQGKPAEARAAYKKALEAGSKDAQQESRFRSMLQVKLDALGGA